MAGSDSSGTKRMDEKDLYKEAWKGRNFEISHLWQRSVFLAAFMLAVASAYGAVILKMYFPENCNCASSTCIQHGIALGICCLGMVLSLLWIMMAKGSKYWYERYESSIDWFVSSSDIFKSIPDYIPRHGNLSNKETDENVFSTAGGKYSVSRINCVIGIVSLVAYAFLIIVHCGKFFEKIFGCYFSSLQCAICGIGFLIMFFTITLCTLRYLCMSEG